MLLFVRCVCKYGATQTSMMMYDIIRRHVIFFYVYIYIFTTFVVVVVIVVALVFFCSIMLCQVQSTKYMILGFCKVCCCIFCFMS